MEMSSKARQGLKNQGLKQTLQYGNCPFEDDVTFQDMFKIDFIVWKLLVMESLNQYPIVFKIDFIVWKYCNKSIFLLYSFQFKIDFIVWK